MKLHIAIPVIDESEWLPHTLESISKQSFRNFKVWICVNQPESWWDLEDKHRICENNAQMLEWLSTCADFDCEVIDRSSRGNGWPDRKGGVGMARKVVMDAIAAEADARDIIVSLDADTLMDSEYLAEVKQKFEDYPDAAGFTARYYHQLTGAPEIDRAILRYEIYMRCYLINLIRIGSPYAFTAMGSALATSVKSYRRVGGMSPKKSAEDFYFLVKLAKSGSLIYGDSARVYPASRKSERVVFGTGQAIMNGYEIMRERYPVFECGQFDKIAETTAGFESLYESDAELPLSDFLRESLNCDDLWGGLRQNHSSRERFVRACHERVDGLRLFQYLRTRRNSDLSDEENLFHTLNTVFTGETGSLATSAARAILSKDLGEWSFDSALIDDLNELRDLLSAVEGKMRDISHEGTKGSTLKRVQ